MRRRDVLRDAGMAAAGAAVMPARRTSTCRCGISASRNSEIAARRCTMCVPRYAAVQKGRGQPGIPLRERGAGARSYHRRECGGQVSHQTRRFHGSYQAKQWDCNTSLTPFHLLGKRRRGSELCLTSPAPCANS